MPLKAKVVEWLKRYLPAEVLSTAVTVLAAWLMHQSGGGSVAVALVSTWSGNLTYFGYILISDIFRSVNQHKLAGEKYTIGGVLVNLRSLVIEFGLAEALDSLLIRPLIMYYVPALINDFTTGILVAKLSADVIFYIPAIVGYELNKKYLSKTV